MHRCKVQPYLATMLACVSGTMLALAIGASRDLQLVAVRRCGPTVVYSGALNTDTVVLNSLLLGTMSASSFFASSGSTNMSGHQSKSGLNPPPFPN